MSGLLDGQESESLMKSAGGQNSYSGEGESGGGSNGGGLSPTAPPTGRGGSKQETADYADTHAPLMSQFHEDAIQQAGMGKFQRVLLLVTGLGLAADTVELFVVAYVIPSAEVELCMTGPMKGWLAAVTFIGMMIGALVWGALGDSVGRRRALLSALLVNAVFGLLTAFMPTYGIFLTTRLCSGIGIGGGIPIVFAYFCEFVSCAERGRYLTWLLVWWAIGGVFTALMAWIIIPRTGISVVLDELHHFSSWRMFLVVCSLPAFTAVAGLYFMPESPRYLLEQGRDVEAIMVYKKIFKWNTSNSPGSEYQLTELELPSGRANQALDKPHGALSGMSCTVDKLWTFFHHLLVPPYSRTTAILLVIWFTSAFGYYGLSVWFPEYIKVLMSEEYDRNATVISGAVYASTKFNVSRLDNYRFLNVTFNNVTFDSMIINHVTFVECSIFDCTFSDIRSSRTYFKNTYLARNQFIDTDMYDYRFQDCDMTNNIFRALVPGCILDFDYNIHYKDVFQENLIGQLTLIPGTLTTALFMDYVGRVRIMSVSFIISSVAAFFIWFLDSKIGIIVFEAVFNFIFISGWNALDICTTESYPAHIRTSAYGFLSAVSRIAGILGTLTFGNFIYVSRAVPMLTTCTVLLVGGLVVLKLPETRNTLV